jgi:CheY-like chemotaxis protein
MTAENGKVGLEVFQAQQENIDLILLDLLMPVMGGEETLKRIRELGAAVPIVLMSGFEEEEAVRRAGEGVFAFVHKPFTFQTLLDVLSKPVRGGLGPLGIDMPHLLE